jgi:hypothetical protein
MMKSPMGIFGITRYTEEGGPPAALNEKPSFDYILAVSYTGHSARVIHRFYSLTLLILFENCNEIFSYP